MELSITVFLPFLVFLQDVKQTLEVRHGSDHDRLAGVDVNFHVGGRHHRLDKRQPRELPTEENVELYLRLLVDAHTCIRCERGAV